VLGINIEDRTKLNVFCEYFDKRRLVLVVPRLMHCCVTNLLEGNIIFELRAYNAEQCSPELVARALSTDDPEVVADTMDKIRREKCMIIELVPTIGCHFVAISYARLEEVEFKFVD
jgi:hypothetical protein